MGDTHGSKVFEVSQEVTNWTIPEVVNDVVDYGTENDWTLYPPFPSGENSSFNDSLEGGNKTSVVARDEELAKVEMAVLALIFILTVVGNCVVLLGIFFRRQKMTRMYYFILHLSVADLITAFFNVLTQLFWEITYRFQGGNLLCKFVKYIQILGPYSSSYVLVMTALDRYQAICYPLSNCTWTAKRSKIMLGVAWTISVLCCVPQIFIFSYRPATDDDPPVYDCWATFPGLWGEKAYVTWYSITVFIIPLVVLVFAYGCITRAIWINFNMKAASRNHDHYERRMTRQDSDDGDAPSNYEQSVDESVFQREGTLSLRTNASQSISSKRSNINLYNPSKQFLTAIRSTSKSSSTDTSGMETSRKGKFDREPNKKSVNNMITTRTSTSSSHNTQSSTLSPSLSGIHKSGSEDKSGERSKNALCYSSQKMFATGGGDPIRVESDFRERHDEEQLQLIPSETDRNEVCLAARSSPSLSASDSKTKEACRACDMNDLDESGNSHQIKNGCVKFSGGPSERPCSHGCYDKNCNHCHLVKGRNDHMNTVIPTNGATRSSIAILNKDMRAVVGAGELLENRDKDQNQTGYRFSGKSGSRHLLLPMKNRFSRNKGSGAAHQNGKQSGKSVTATYVADQQPRTHSIKGISRAKIKTIKLTVTIICCYIFCSSPFIAAQLWWVYDPNAKTSSFWKGPTFAILTLLASLNSCVNPYIFLFFNPNLLQSCFHGIFRPKFPGRRYNNGGSPMSRTLSQGKKTQLGVVNRGSMNIGKYNSATGLHSDLRRGNSYNRPNPRSPSVPTEEAKPHLTSSSLRSSLHRGIDNSKSNQPFPLQNGSSETGYLGNLLKKNEPLATAVELVETMPSPLQHEDSLQDANTSRTSQLCRVETTLLENAKNSPGTVIT